VDAIAMPGNELHCRTKPNILVGATSFSLHFDGDAK
jgi:hypothetical protein